MNTKQVLFFNPLSMTSQFNPSNFISLFEAIEKQTKEVINEDIKRAVKRLSLNKQKTFKDVSNGLNILKTVNEVGITLECYDYMNSDVLIRAKILRSPTGHLVAEVQETLEKDWQGVHSWYVKSN